MTLNKKQIWQSSILLLYSQINKQMDNASNGITTDQQIIALLQSCNRCSKLTGNSSHVLSHTELAHFVLPNLKKKKWGFVVNSQPYGSNSIGHWWTIIIFDKFCYVFDGLCQIHKNNDVMKNVRSFCTLNNLKYTNGNLRYQLANSLNCGWLATYFIAKASLLKHFAFVKLITFLRRFSLKSRENIILKFVFRHYKIDKNWLMSFLFLVERQQQQHLRQLKLLLIVIAVLITACNITSITLNHNGVKVIM